MKNSKKSKQTKQTRDDQELIDSGAMKKRNKFSAFFFNLYRRLKNRSTVKTILFWYLLVTVIGGFLLWTPWTQKTSNWGEIKFVDALFISASAFSDTGLSTLGVSDTFNKFGQFVIFLLFQLGGIGLFTIKIVFIKYILRRVVPHKVTVQAQEEFGTTTKKETLNILKVAVYVNLVATVVFGIIFGIMFATVEAKPLYWDFNKEIGKIEIIKGEGDPGLKGNWGEAFWAGFFHAGSSINNAGFDIFKHNKSLGVYYGNYWIQIFTVFLLVLGGIGFTVVYDVQEYFKKKYRKEKFTFSLLTKISVVSYLIIVIVGMLSTYMFEGIQAVRNYDEAWLTRGDTGVSHASRAWAVAFTTFSTRNAGFATIDLNFLSVGTTVNHGLLMFIGSGPGSTAGGIRTTTTAVIFLTIWAYMRGRNHTSAFNRTIPQEQVKESFLIYAYSTILVFTSILVIAGVESKMDHPIASQGLFMHTFYLVSSAFGTTGLSTVDVGRAHTFTKVWIIFVMFIGQLGIGTTMKQMRTKRSRGNSESIFIEEGINLG